MSESAKANVAKIPANVVSKERRAWPRVPCRIGSTCQPTALPTAAEPEPQWFGEIWNISAGGALLVLPRRFEPGSTLVLELAGQRDGNIHSIQATVVRVAKQANNWALGV